MAASAAPLRRRVPIPGRLSRSTAVTLGFQADIYQQNGGSIPTITLQYNATRSVPDAALATTSYNTILEVDYALNADETRGLLAGAQYTRVDVDTPFARVSPNIVGYVGGYYQWDNNWKFTGRFGVQSVRRRAASELDAVSSRSPSRSCGSTSTAWTTTTTGCSA